MQRSQIPPALPNAGQGGQHAEQCCDGKGANARGLLRPFAFKSDQQANPEGKANLVATSSYGKCVGTDAYTVRSMFCSCA